MKIEQPPTFGDQIASQPDAYKHFANPEVMKLARRANYEYWYWTELKHKPLPEGVPPADVWAIVNVLQSSESTGSKVVWTLVILLLPVLGFIIWYFAGPKIRS